MLPSLYFHAASTEDTTSKESRDHQVQQIIDLDELQSQIELGTTLQEYQDNCLGQIDLIMEQS